MPPAPPHKPPRVRPLSSNYLAPSSSSLTIGRSRRRRGRRSHGSSGGLLLYPRSGCPASPAAEVLRSMQSRSMWRFTLTPHTPQRSAVDGGGRGRPIPNAALQTRWVFLRSCAPPRRRRVVTSYHSKCPSLLGPEGRKVFTATN